MSSRPSPLPNRVTPFGEICAVPDRGGMFGNRGGRIHSDGFTITRRQASQRWICCVLSFKGRQRRVMGKGYTELFFLDEATALASGHRPCFECRRADAKAFATAWARGQGMARPAMADEMDRVLNVERRAPAPAATHAELAYGAMVASGGEAYLFDGSRFCRWSFGGYEPAQPKGALTLLTPASALAALHAGFRPMVHSSV
ncbi:MAG: hypothetical protein AAF367_13615 [Pseudomonadota bacterium]